MPTADPIRDGLVEMVAAEIWSRRASCGPEAVNAYVGASVGVLVAIEGRAATARLLRLLATRLEAGAFSEPAGCRANREGQTK